MERGKGQDNVRRPYVEKHATSGCWSNTDKFLGLRPKFGSQIVVHPRRSDCQMHGSQIDQAPHRSQRRIHGITKRARPEGPGDEDWQAGPAPLSKAPHCACSSEVTSPAMPLTDATHTKTPLLESAARLSPCRLAELRNRDAQPLT
eukprot:1041511-Pleurochrysis_carterae.AAC.2